MQELLSNDLVNLAVLIILIIIMVLAFKLKDCIFLNRYIPYYKYDYLTNLELRQDFDNKVSKLIAKGSPFFFSLVDINDLHSINKIQGYRAGDAVIKETADEISALLKGKNNLNIYRIGGDEFIVIAQDNVNLLLDKMTKASYFTTYFNNDKDYNTLFDEVDQGLIQVKRNKILKGEFQDRRHR
ncbi:MAG: diguanylate cyclase [Pseudomonadota bacterium]|nr:diguanylate cyclase [Pseudomonadota bacterium]